jgi:recombinational DNA repair ATPase RecF
MSRSDLESLTITKVRGVVEPFTLNFETDRRLCIVYGENGTGKSTLCDALDLLGSEQIGSLDGRGLGKVERYLAPLSHATAVGSVELKTRSGAAYTASIQGGRVKVAVPQPRVLVLRRPQLLKIINASPADRYRAISELVDVSGVSASEQTLSNLLKQTERDAEDGANRVAGAKEILDKLFSAAAGAGDSIDWARQEVVRDSAESVILARAVGELRNAYETLKHRRLSYGAAESKLRSASAATDAAAADLAAFGQGDALADPEVVALLEAAARALSILGAVEVCPLCSGTDGVAGLVPRIHERLTTMEKLRVALARRASATRDSEIAEAGEQRERESYAVERGAFLATQARQGEFKQIPLPALDPPQELSELSEWIERFAPLAEEWERRRIELAGLADQRQQLSDAVLAYDQSYALAERASKLAQTLRTGHAVVQSTRHAFVNAVLNDVSQEVGHLYEVVHPGEGLGKINLSLDAKRRESLSLSVSFQASQVPPQAYFSDSHLDTLGLCIFLALSKRRDASAAMLVLDDVLASVDEPHVDRLIEMIYQEAQQFRHVLVTTHYRPWREKLRWGWLKHGPCQVVELGGWSAKAGPTLIRSTAEVERLRRLLGAPDFDQQAACAKAGVVLEALLDFLTELYQCNLPRKPRNEWTLGDLLPAIDKRLRKALRIEHQDPNEPTRYSSHDLGPLLEELTQIAQTRNVLGAHFSRLSFDTLHAADAERFARRVLELADLLVHSEHGWPRSSKSGSYWSCAKDARRLHPLQKPQ